MNLTEFQNATHKIIENVKNVIIGKDASIQLALICLLCKGHLLINDVPGLGKTMLAKSLSTSVGGKYNRIQFTSDLLPSDIIGITMFNQKNSEFQFKPGPIFSNIVLADEINRAPPRTQSAMLESMDERKVSIDGITHKLDEPFFLIATQNPLEYEGTYPLPEAQLDRFFMQISLGYLKPEEEISLLGEYSSYHPIDRLEPVISLEEIFLLQNMLNDVHVDPSLKQYTVTIINKTRNNSDIFLGSSPRGSIALYNAAKALAAMNGRDYIIPDDIKGHGKTRFTAPNNP